MPDPNFQPGPSANRFKMRVFSPKKKYWNFLRVYPTSENVSKDQFVWMCRKLNYPFCPHLRTDNAEVIELFPPERSKSLNCRHCRSKVSLKNLSCSLPEGGDYWCVFETRRYLGRSISPLERTWLAQTFASRDPNLGSYIDAAHAWSEVDWERQRTVLLNRFKHTPPDHVPLFQPVTLPDTAASRAARRRVQALSVAQWLIPEWAHVIFGPRQAQTESEWYAW